MFILWTSLFISKLILIKLIKSLSQSDFDLRLLIKSILDYCMNILCLLNTSYVLLNIELCKFIIQILFQLLISELNVIISW